MPDKIIAAACGLRCDQCPAHTALRTDDDELRRQTAQQWNAQYAAFGAHFEPRDINCSGCRERGPKSGYTDHCPVRACATERGLAGCGACAELTACDIVIGFKKNGLDIVKNFADLEG